MEIAEVTTRRSKGRPRAKVSAMPKGMRFVDARWYWRPTDELTRCIAQRIDRGRLSFPAGKTEDQALEWYADNVLPLLPFASPTQRIPSAPSPRQRARRALKRALQFLGESADQAPGLVYFARCGTGAVKIGYTQTADTLKRRLAALRTAAPESVTLLETFAGSMALERACHQLLHNSRSNGEWFEDSPFLVMLRERAREMGLAGAVRFFCQRGS